MEITETPLPRPETPSIDPPGPEVKPDTDVPIDPPWPAPPEVDPDPAPPTAPPDPEPTPQPA